MVVSITCGRTARMPSRSLELHQQVVDAGAAVDARSSATGAPPAATASRLIACSSAALWKRDALQRRAPMCATVLPRVRPTMAPRASAFQ